MRILLTGATGQVGSALGPKLAHLGEVIAPGRADFDLALPESLPSGLDRIRPDLIVNCAAYTAVDLAEDEVDVAFTVNAKAPATMSAWAAARAAPMLHISTDYVFDGSGTRAWSEVDPTRPLSVYGRSKLEGENAVRNSGAPHLVVRTSWVYAATGKNFLRTIVGLALARPELRIVADQMGAPTSAETIAGLLTELIERHRADLPAGFGRADGLCHLTAQGTTSWHGFASAVVDGLRCRGLAPACRMIAAIGTVEYPTRAVRPRNSRLSLERLGAVYGLVPPHWHAGLEAELDKYVTATLT
ncbi:MAG TPA: dTDP-4-dehydrorhamnose reductase [Bradyrhizobium sp.]